MGGALVRYDGSRLWRWTDPLDAHPTWEVLATIVGERVVALTSCADLNPQHAQLFAATDSSRLLSWTWRGSDAADHADTGWHSWQPSVLGMRPVALAGWSLGAGQQEMVVADTAGGLWGRRRSDWSEWSAWACVGEIRDVVALDALASHAGSVELYAVTADGELKRTVRGSAHAGGDHWGDVEVVADWADPAVAVACWSLDETADQAVLLASREVRQRWRRPGDPAWSDWWTAPAAPLPGEAVALAGWAGDHGRQAIAALGDTDHLSLRPWVAEGGWRPWLPAVRLATQQATAPLIAMTPNGGSPTPNGGTLTANPAFPPVNGDHRAAAGEMVDVAPIQALDPAQLPKPVHALDPQARDAARAEEATVLFAGRALLPLLPGDPDRIGPFLLQKRIPGGQASTDKFVARDGRGYCFLKVLKPDAPAEEETAFHRESEMARRVVDRHRLASFIEAHPGDDAQRPYLALSFEQGKHLGELSDGRPMAPADLLHLARGLLEALVELRDCHLLHLDIKPANVIMRHGDYPVVVDFGSAVPAETGQLVEAAFGTVAYAAPEFVGQRAVNPTTDTYSWAAVLLAAASGSTPARDPRARAEQVARLPEQLRDLVSAALSEDPANRPTLEAAARRLARTQPLGVGVGDRLPIDRLTLSPQATEQPTGPGRLAADLGALTAWRYRLGAGAAAAAGVVLGFLVGVFLVQLLRSF